MASDTGRDDFIIAIRSAFLKKGTRQKFSLFTLLIISLLVLSLEYFKTGPVNVFRSFTKDLIFKGSYFISEPFVYIKNNYYNFKKHLNMYDEYTELKKKDYNLTNLIYENNFYKSENKRLKILITKHVKNTKSEIGIIILNNWSKSINEFVKVVPKSTDLLPTVTVLPVNPVLIEPLKGEMVFADDSNA